MCPRIFLFFSSDASVTLPDFPPAKIKLMTKTARPSNYIQEKFDSNATKYIAEDVLLLKSEWDCYVLLQEPVFPFQTHAILENKKHYFKSWKNNVVSLRNQVQYLTHLWTLIVLWLKIRRTQQKMILQLLDSSWPQFLEWIFEVTTKHLIWSERRGFIVVI